MFEKFNSLVDLIAAFPTEKRALTIWKNVHGKDIQFHLSTRPQRFISVKGLTTSVKTRGNISMSKQERCFIIRQSR